MADKVQKVSELAYSIWESEGRPEGQSDRHWQMAEKAVETLTLTAVAASMNAEGARTAGGAVGDEELETTLRQAASLDQPERALQIKSS
jgi:hypothetical protein